MGRNLLVVDGVLLFWLSIVRPHEPKSIAKYSGCFLVVTDIDDVAKRWDNVDVDASEYERGLTHRDRLCSGKTFTFFSTKIISIKLD